MCSRWQVPTPNFSLKKAFDLYTFIAGNNNNKPVKPTTTTTVKKTTTKTPAPTNNTPSGYSIIPGGVSGKSDTTRYWDCCKPSCGWNGKAHVTSPVKTCAKNGVTVIDNNIQSGCAAGGSKKPY